MGYSSHGREVFISKKYDDGTVITIKTKLSIQVEVPNRVNPYTFTSNQLNLLFEIEKQKYLNESELDRIHKITGEQNEK